MGDAFDPASSAPAAGPVASKGTSRPARDRGLDVMRGMVILLMVIDHVRFFLSSARFDPTDPALTTAGALLHPLGDPLLRSHVHAARRRGRLSLARPGALRARELSCSC